MAGEGKKTFVAGEVLTAQDVNGFLMDQSVMNFASSAARGSAIPTPTEGMVSYLADTNALEFFDGSSFVSINAASASGLTLIKTQTIGTAVPSVNVTGAFSATFDNYKILVSGGVASADVGGNVTLGATAAGYSVAARGLSFAGVGSDSNTNAGSSFAGIISATTSVISGNFELQNPFTAKKTVLSFAFTNPTSGAQSRAGGGFLDNTLSYTDFTITPPSGTYTGGTIFVYGYVK